MRKNILIVGAGQLGSRYLQGMVKVSFPLDIHVVDISAESLARAESRWAEVADEKTMHKPYFLQILDALPKQIDLVIVATSADVRSRVVAEVSQRANVAYWVLEKVLAQSDTELRDMAQLIGSGKAAWVNTPMHMWSLYREIKRQHVEPKAIDASFEGFQGMACNAIHYIDFVSRWNGGVPVSMDTSGLLEQWHPAKRDGFWEIHGTLLVNFSDGSRLKLSTGEDDRDYRVQLKTHQDQWCVYESKGIAESDSGRVVQGKCEFQSQLTAPLVESILTAERCDLPTLEESVAQHRIFLEGLMAHWNSFMEERRVRLPIT